MDILDHRGRAVRLALAAVIGALAGLAPVRVAWEVLDYDSSSAPGWFAMFTWSMTFLLVTIAVNAGLTAYAKRRWHLPIPVARVVRR